MKRFSIYAASAILLMLAAASCKEHVAPPTADRGVDSTYLTTPEAVVQEKRILIEELSGVQCPNCPAGSVQLDTLSAHNPGILEIVTIHTGALTAMIPDLSRQDFTTEDGKTLRDLVWGEQGNKPTAAFDRRPYGNEKNTYFVNVYTNWPNAIARCKTDGPTTPVNIHLTSTYDTANDAYNIEATVAYTKSVTGQQALNIFLVESNIVDAQEYSQSDIDTNYVFNHMFRRSITPAVGKIFLDTLATKEAGRVYVYRAILKIDKADEKQKFWNPANMHLVAFVSMAEADDKHVLQVQGTDLQ